MAYSQVNGDPKALLASTKDCVEAHSDLNYIQGLCQPVATLGCHPWLRDSLSTTGEDEPGNAEPAQGLKVPFEDAD
jgi:hypothetical protein